MIKRTVEISTPGSIIRKHNDQLIVETDGQILGTVPIEDLGILILDGPQLTITSSLMQRLAECNVSVVFTDSRHLPCSTVVPLEGHSLQAKIMRAQLSVSVPKQKRLWTALVKAKIRNQAAVLRIGGKSSDEHLIAVANRVKSGDPKNLEAYAARIYWPSLFGKHFRRDRESSDLNSFLNYGYAIARATIARAIVGTGLNPGFGICHRNQYNAFPLADDLVEPIRPFWDLCVLHLSEALQANNQSRTEAIELTRPIKKKLLEVLSSDCVFDGRKLPLFVAIGYFAASVKQFILGEINQPVFPEL